ncbi:MAG: hypothetical protein HY695_29590 [Deltaproteobacteria bacterium]|nr:hypothetical protein [Deltaproteobacteria bacterium]
MGKILLIEPQNILRHAITLFLFPEHQVRAQEQVSVSEIGSFQDCDLLIVDAAALRENNQLSPDLARALQSCRIPTVWLDEDDSVEVPGDDRLVKLKRPLERQAFQAAISKLLSPERASGEPARSDGVEPGSTALSKVTAGRAGQTGDGAPQPIELVDVVEQEATSKDERKVAKPK